MENLQASPCVRFNKEGTLLAVSTGDYGVRILATDNGFRLLRTAENRLLATKVYFLDTISAENVRNL